MVRHTLKIVPDNCWLFPKTCFVCFALFDLKAYISENFQNAAFAEIFFHAGLSC